MIISDASDAIARAFVSARKSAHILPTYPGPMPTTLDLAYTIQDRAIARDGGEIAGWKVGRLSEADLARYDVNRLAGPIFKRCVQFDDGMRHTMPVFEGGFGAAEAEFLLRVGRDVPANNMSCSLEEAAALVDAVHVGIEIASSPFPGINTNGPAVTISDFGNNNGLIVGAQIPHWRTSGFENWPVAVRIDGQEIGRATTQTMLDGAVGAVRFLIELLTRRGITVPAGTWVSTGAVTGVHEVRPGQLVEAHFDGQYAITCTIEAAKTA